jgi:hypothetical protein
MWAAEIAPEEGVMLRRVEVLAWVLLASACSAEVGSDEEVLPDQERQATLATRVVTAYDLLTCGEALWVDLTPKEAAVRFEGLKSMSDLARVNVIIGSDPPTTADDMVRRAGIAVGKELPRDLLSLRANVERLTGYRPSPECAGVFPTPGGCCACGIIGRPCLGFVCIDPQLE